jgi:subtilisin family serine protease
LVKNSPSRNATLGLILHFTVAPFLTNAAYANETQEIPTRLIVKLDLTHESSSRLIDAARLSEGPAARAHTQSYATLGNPSRSSALRQAAPGNQRPELLSADGTPNVDREIESFIFLEYPTAQAARAAKARIESRPEVVNVSYDLRVDFGATPQEPLFTQQPSAPATSNYQWSLAPSTLNVTSAWDRTLGHANIAIIDSGIQVGHPDLTDAFRPFLAFGVHGGTADEKSGMNGVISFGHGTHVAGIIAANTRFPPFAGTGTAGVCPGCNLIVAKVSVPQSDGGNAPTIATLSSGITRAVDAGAQVVNLSLGVTNDLGCQNAAFSAICTALSYAASRDVVVVSAAGNRKREQLDFPANDPRVIPVGGSAPGGLSWIQDYGDTTTGSNYSTLLRERGVAAPALDIVSTFYSGESWNNRCKNATSANGAGTVSGFQISGLAVGVCTGTSMSTPHVSGVIGLMRSANPTLPATSIQAILRSSSSLAYAPTHRMGAGVPNSRIAIDSVTGTRVAHLFSLVRSQGYGPHLNTTIPQVASSAIHDLLPPRSIAKLFEPYTPIGSPVSKYYFPGTSVEAKKIASIFTTSENPISTTTRLLPLYRFVGCGAGPCSSPWVEHTRFAYGTSRTDFSGSFSLVGIEGYIFPASSPQPANTVPLYRGFRAAVGDYALFTPAHQSQMQGFGFTSQTLLGYVYP